MSPPLRNCIKLSFQWRSSPNLLALPYLKFSINTLYFKTTSSSVIREMQIKITMRCHYTLTILAKITIFYKVKCWYFPGGPVVKSPPSNAGDTGLIPGQRTKIPHAAGQLSPWATTNELIHLNERVFVPQTTEPTRSGACAPQLERENLHATTREKPQCCNEETTRRNERSRVPQQRSRVPQLRPDTAKKK